MTELVIKKIRTTSGDVQIEPIQASTTQLGGVKVDGETITINDGVISCPSASTDIGFHLFTEASHVYLDTTFASGVTTDSVDISHIIPKDGGNYLIYCTTRIRTDKTANKMSYINYQLPNNKYWNICAVTSETSSYNTTMVQSLFLPVREDRMFNYEFHNGGSGTTGTNDFSILGYIKFGNSEDYVSSVLDEINGEVV